jgi:hypothetical protein
VVGSCEHSKEHSGYKEKGNLNTWATVSFTTWCLMRKERRHQLYKEVNTVMFGPKINELRANAEQQLNESN